MQVKVAISFVIEDYRIARAVTEANYAAARVLKTHTPISEDVKTKLYRADGVMRSRFTSSQIPEN